MLGQGTFGQVAKCWGTKSNNYVAVKVIKNQPAFYQQAIMEVSLLSMVRFSTLSVCLMYIKVGITTVTILCVCS
jgi:hypothetical protein